MTRAAPQELAEAAVDAGGFRDTPDALACPLRHSEPAYVPASELDDDEVLAEHAADAGLHGSDYGPTPDAAWVSSVDPRRWGFLEDGKFVPVPKRPLTLVGLQPPCTVMLYGGERAIIVEPVCPICLAELAPGAECERCADPGEAHEPVANDGEPT